MNNNECLKIRAEAQECLNQMSIIDGNSFINNILFELSETDENNIEIKKETLEEIKQLLNLKNMFKIKNEELYFLRNLGEELRKQENLAIDDNTLNKLFIIIKNNF